MKSKYNFIFSLLFILFSFFYTNKIIQITRKSDPIMQEVIRYSDNNVSNTEEAVLLNDSIIPGIKGEEVDVEKSYTVMKKIGKFDKNLIVFKEAKLDETIDNNMDKYIISGNKNRQNVSIVIKLEDTSYLEEILSILNKKEVLATFFLENDIFDNSIDAIKVIEGFGHDVELLSSKYTIYEVNKYNSILKLISNDKLKFCLNQKKDNKILDNCISSKLYSVIPSISVTNYLYNSIKNNLENGSIILIPNTLSNVRELSATINYIKQRGKKIVLLSNLIQE